MMDGAEWIVASEERGQYRLSDDRDDCYTNWNVGYGYDR